MQPSAISAANSVSLIRLAPAALLSRGGDANPNVLSLALGSLPQLRSALMTGDAITCKNAACGAAMSKWTKREGDRWTCDFCGEANVAELEEPEIPTQASLDYVLEPSKAPAGAVAADDTAVVFCIDVSGSMCVTTEYDGGAEESEAAKRSQAKAKECAHLNAEGAQQRLPRERRNVRYISRLEAVQTALKGQIDAMAKNHMGRKIGVVTFSSEVEVIGDASVDPVHLAGDALGSFDAVIAAGEAYPLKQTVQQSKDRLWAKIKNLEEGGATALGPALAASVAMAGKRAGSQVVICTDGLANVGLGALDELKTPEQRGAAEGFYERIAQMAKERGVSVSVLSISGTECRLENLGHVADVTGGAVSFVSPVDMAKNFSAVLSDQLIATGASLTCLVSPAFAFEGAASRLRVDLGNLTTASEHTLALVPKPEAAAAKEAVLQVQLAYRQLDGALRLHIATLCVPVTSDESIVEKNLNIQVVGSFVSRTCAKLVQNGLYQEVRRMCVSYRKMLARAAQTDQQKLLFERFNQEMASAEAALRAAERAELLAGVRIESETEGNVAQLRSIVRDDVTAQKMYAMKGKEGAFCCVQ